MRYYFAYGSNMDLDHVNCWCKKNKLEPIKPTEICSAKLEGYKLCFNYFSERNWKAGAANIMRLNNNCVYGLLMLLNENEIRNIRKKEGCKNPNQSGGENKYDQIEVKVKKLNDNVEVDNVITYKAAPEREKKQCQPSTYKYKKLMINVAEKYDFPIDYKERLNCIITQKPKMLNHQINKNRRSFNGQ